MTTRSTPADTLGGKSGELPEMLHWLLDPNCSDPQFVSVFLMTHTYYMSYDELLAYLTDLFARCKDHENAFLTRISRLGDIVGHINGKKI